MNTKIVAKVSNAYIAYKIKNHVTNGFRTSTAVINIKVMNVRVNGIMPIKPITKIAIAIIRKLSNNIHNGIKVIREPKIPSIKATTVIIKSFIFPP